MAKNKVEIDVKVDDKGTTKKLGLESKKAAKGLEDTAKNARTADRNIKGTAQASSNATKNFSKMAQGTGGLVAAYATLAANIFAISAAFQFLKKAGDLRALEASQNQYASKTGLNMKLVTSRIQEATGSIVSFQEASQAAAIGTAAGLSPDQLERLASAAKNAAAALGRDTTDAFQRLTRGAIKAEPELLDELGIIIRLDTATKEYKKTLKDSSRELTTFEKTQAVVIATLEQAEEKFNDIGDNVNDVARLGKSFDDLVKSIQRAIVGPAEFIADVFTKNVYALSAAFALLGVNITKAMAPTVDFGDLSEVAGGAKQRIQGAALPGSKTGAALASGDFSQQNLNQLKRSAGKKTSTVIAYSKMEEKQLRRDIKLIEAEHTRAMAVMKGGFKGYVLGAIANLKLMQAQHGMVMGTLKAGVAGFASFASKAMSAIAIVGMLTLALSMAKELMNLLKSKELRAMEDRAEQMRNRFREQNEALTTTVDTLDKAETKMGRIVQYANIFSQVSTKGSSRLLDGVISLESDKLFKNAIGQGSRGKFDVVTTGERAIARAQRNLIAGKDGTITEFANSMIIASKAAKEAGKDTSSLDHNVGELQFAMETLTDANLNTKEGVKSYNEALEAMRGLIPAIVADKNILQVSLGGEKGAVMSVTEAYKQYEQIVDGLKGKQTVTTRLVNGIKAFSGSLQGMTSIAATDTLGGLTDENATKMAAVLGMSEEDFRKLTKQQAMDKFSGIGTNLLADQSKLTKGPQERAKALAEAQRTGLGFVKQQAQVTKQIGDIDHQILEMQHQKNLAAAGKVKLTQDELDRIESTTAALEAQKTTIQRNMSDIGRISDALGSSLEQGLGAALTGLIQGTMTVKEAFASMAQTMINAVVKVVAEMMAIKMIKGLFGNTAFGDFLGITARNGGVFSAGKDMTGYSAGGVARGSTQGYPAVLHGTEAVVPLPNGRSIPVEMKSAGQQNNVVVNVSAEGQTSVQSSNGMDGENLGKAVAAAVQKELQNQKRSGGILSPYGAA